MTHDTQQPITSFKCKWINNALTFGESFLEAFPVNVSQDVMGLPVDVSDGQLTEELIAGGEEKKKQTDNTKWRSASHIQSLSDICFGNH